jgi:hypothetical protein
MSRLGVPDIPASKRLAVADSPPSLIRLLVRQAGSPRQMLRKAMRNP